MHRLRTVAAWLGLIVLALAALILARTDGPAPAVQTVRVAQPAAERAAAPEVSPERRAAADNAQPIDAAAVLARADKGELAAFVFDADGALYVRTTDDAWHALPGGYAANAQLYSTLAQRGTPVEALQEWAPVDTGTATLAEAEAESRTWGSLVAPILLLLGVGVLALWFLRRYQQGAANGFLALRRSPARQLTAPSHLKFADIGGLEPIKERLQDVIDLLQKPAAWEAAGVRPPRGVLLEGPPGCGKTLLARAVAGEAGVPVFVMSATDLVEMFVGVGAARVRDTFETARKAAPAVLFIDELDAVGRRRGAGAGAMTHGELEQTLNQLLVCLDGAERAQGKQALLVVMAATNRADILDPALLRPGRFDLRLTVTPPDLAGRRAILGVHTRRLRLDDTVDLDAFAASAAGATGAELELACNEAAVQAARRGMRNLGSPLVSAADLEAGLRGARRVVEGFDAVDALLVESAGQLARPRGETPVRVHVEGEEALTGRLLWADPGWLKLALDDGGERLIPKLRLRGVEALEGAGTADPAALRAPPGPSQVA